MKFVFASFLTIISISQSKRDCRRTRRSDSMVANASKWWFLKFHAHWAYPNQLLEIAKVMKNRYFFLFLSLQRARKVSKYTSAGLKSCQIPRSTSLQNIVAIAPEFERKSEKSSPSYCKFWNSALYVFNWAEKWRKVNKDNTIHSRFGIITLWAFFSHIRVTMYMWWLENVFKQQKEGWNLCKEKKASLNPASFT